MRQRPAQKGLPLAGFRHLVSVAVAVVSDDGELLDCNAGFQRLLDACGKTVSENVADVFIAPDFAQLHGTAADSGGVVHDGILTIGDPQKTCHSLIGTVHRDAQCLILVAEFDVVEMERLNAQVIQLNEQLTHAQRELGRTERGLRQAREVADRANLAKSEFLSRMSHELRTPLNSILGFTQLLAMDPTLSAEHRDELGHVERSGKILLSLIEDVLALSSIEAGGIRFSAEPVIVGTLTEQIFAMVQHLASPFGIQLIDEGGDAVDAQINVDPIRLQQVVLNLLTNAIKYNRRHGSVRLSFRRTEIQRQPAVRIAVADTGHGIPADKQHRLFVAFDRLGHENGVIQGTGIGLLTTRRITEAMGGTIGFESVEGQGSTFWVAFPIDTVETMAKSPHGVRPSRQGMPAVGTDAAGLPDQGIAVPPLPRWSILYIENDESNQLLVRKIIAQRPEWELLIAPTAELGLEYVRSAPPAVILMDICLPGMSGYDVHERLQSDPATAGIPVIALTAYAMEKDRERGRVAGFTAYLTKPVDVRVLMETLANLQDRQRNVGA